MVELAGMANSARGGLEGCFREVTNTDNIPVYAGIGVGAIGGNYSAQQVDKIVTDNFVSNPTALTSTDKFMKFGARSIGRILFSGLACAASGMLDNNDMGEKFLSSAAIGSSGMIAVDGLKTYGGSQIGSWADLGTVPTRRFEPAPRARAVPARQNRTPSPRYIYPANAGKSNAGRSNMGTAQQPRTITRASGLNNSNNAQDRIMSLGAIGGWD